MSYVLKHGNDYIAKAYDGSLYITSNAESAMKLAEEKKAVNIRKSLPRQIRAYGAWNVTKIEDKFQCIQTKKETINSQPNYTPVSMDKVTEMIQGLSEQFRTMQDNTKWLEQQLSESDQEILDLLHYIEFYDFNACEGYKLAKKLKNIRLKRRNAKNQLEAIKIINNTCNMLANGSTDLALRRLDNQHYKPRILTEMFEGRKH